MSETVQEEWAGGIWAHGWCGGGGGESKVGSHPINVIVRGGGDRRQVKIIWIDKVTSHLQSTQVTRERYF